MHDAAGANEADGSSQEGCLLFFTDENMQRGQVAPMCLADWTSWKLERICRSSLAAEAQSHVDALDALDSAILFLLEIALHQSAVLGNRLQVSV